MPPSPHSEACNIVSQSSSTSARLASRSTPAGDVRQRLRAAHRADPAGRALAAGLVRAELHCIMRHLQHVDGVVEGDDAAVAEHGADRGQRLVFERRVELRGRQVGAERAADLHGADRPAGRGAAAVVLEQFPDRQAERALDEAAVAHVAGELQRHRSARLRLAEIAVGRGAVGEHRRHGRERDDVVDDGRRPEQAFLRRQRRPHPDLAAAALEALEHRGFLAADVGARAEPQFDVEVALAAQDVPAEAACAARRLERRGHDLGRVRVFDAQIDVSARRADGDTRDRHALDQAVRIALHQHAIGERARVALVGVAGDVALPRRLVEHGLPLDAGRKRGAAAPAQAGLEHFLDGGGGPDLERAPQPAVTAGCVIGIEVERVDVPDAREGQALLRREPRMLPDRAEPQGMRRALQQSLLQQFRDIARGDRAIGDAAGGALDFDERLEPVQSAGTVAAQARCLRRPMPAARARWPRHRAPARRHRAEPRRSPS